MIISSAVIKPPTNAVTANTAETTKTNTTKYGTQPTDTKNVAVTGNLIIARSIHLIGTKKFIGIKNSVCPIESALANMHIGQEKNVSKILILSRESKPVVPCGKCRDLLVSLGQGSAEILFDIGSLQTKTMEELNPYYKSEEKV